MGYITIPFITKTQIGSQDLSVDSVIDLNKNESGLKNWDDAELLVTLTDTYFPKGFDRLAIDTTKVGKGRYKVEPYIDISEKYWIGGLSLGGINTRNTLTTGYAQVNGFVERVEMYMNGGGLVDYYDEYTVKLFIDGTVVDTKQFKHFGREPWTKNFVYPIKRYANNIEITIESYLSKGYPWPFTINYSYYNMGATAYCSRRTKLPSKIDYIAVEKK